MGAWTGERSERKETGLFKVAWGYKFYSEMIFLKNICVKYIYTHVNIYTFIMHI